MNSTDQRAAVTAGPRELVTRAYFTGYADGLGGRAPHYRAPQRTAGRRPADAHRHHPRRAHREPHMSSTPDTVDVEPPKTREGNGYPHAARTPQ